MAISASNRTVCPADAAVADTTRFDAFRAPNDAPLLFVNVMVLNGLVDPTAPETTTDPDVLMLTLPVFANVESISPETVIPPVVLFRARLAVLLIVVAPLRAIAPAAVVTDDTPTNATSAILILKLALADTFP